MKNYPFVVFTLFLFILLSLQAPAGAYPQVGPGPSINGVQIFPSDDIWNVAVDQLPVDIHSVNYVSKIGTNSPLHPDFGSGLWAGHAIGIPYNVVTGPVAKKTVTFDYAGESDSGPYPIPANPVIEGGSDRHILIVDQNEKILYELYDAAQLFDGSWHAGSGAIFNLSGYTLRPAGWTSADAAGLPILPGLVRYDEVNAGEITHAIRFTAPSTQRAYVWPARHYASTITDPAYPPMGQRFRLKSSFNTSGYPYQARVVLDALKKYGMVLADNGGAWYISGSPDERWDNEALHTLAQLKGSDFEAVNTSSLMIKQDSGQARTSSPPVYTGSLAITSSPSGATVFVDNANQGTTPIVLTTIAPGFHDIKCTKSGYRDQSQTVQVTANQSTNVNFILEVLQSVGSIFVQSNPTGAKIYLDNSYTGSVTPKTIVNIPAGSHIIRCNLSGYSDNSKTVSVSAGQTASVTINLASVTPKGSISIQSNPAGAKIYLGDSETGFLTPKILLNIVTGNHVIRCSLNGYADSTQTVSVSSGQRTDVMFTLQKSGTVAPKADFSASPTSGPYPVTVQFTDKSTNAPTTWSWSFGDGSTSTEQNPVHTYMKPGTYSVKLKVSNLAGANSLSRSNCITVLSGPKPTPTVTPTPTPTTVPTNPAIIIEQSTAAITQSADTMAGYSPFAVANHGGTPLSYTVTDQTSWLTISSGASATVPPNDRSQVSVQVDTHGLVRGHSYWAVFAVTSNDPFEDAIPVLFRVTVS